jgi:hypothetical protein
MHVSLRRSLAWICAVVLVPGLIGCAGSPIPTVADEKPAVVEAIDGDPSRHRITVTAKAAQRLGLELVQVSAAPGSVGSIRVPYSSIIYDAEGDAWAYVAEQPLVFVRESVIVEDVVPNDTGGLAVLSQGPRAGTSVVSVGVAELFGTEFEVGH